MSGDFGAVTGLSREDCDEIRARLAAATNAASWHWAGNTDMGEPYLATWVSGAGRRVVLSIGHEDRSILGPAADRVRSSAEEYGLGDPEQVVADWAVDSFGEPMQDPRLQLIGDLALVDARDLAVYEVAPEATTREDPRVYRADVVGIRHPDAIFIASAGRDLTAVLTALDAAEAEVERLRAALTNREATMSERIASAEKIAADVMRERDDVLAEVERVRDQRHRERTEERARCVNLIREKFGVTNRAADWLARQEITSD